MGLKKKDIRIETTKGRGHGGQRKNKVETMVKATHIPTGISISIDGRNQYQNKKQALKGLEEKVQQFYQEKKDAAKKEYRDQKIKERNIIRTYDYKTGQVTDHRTNKTASIKNIIKKGKINLLK